MTQEVLQILLVEDNPNDAKLTLHALREDNLVNNIQVARDGEEALDVLFCRGKFAGRSFENPPRLVLLDLKLPKVDGLEVLRAVKGDPRTRAIPIVVLTSSREERDVVESYRVGVNAYIQKPVEFDSFRHAVKQLGLFWLLINQSPPAKAFQP
jgi:two-component system, response regulator